MEKESAQQQGSGGRAPWNVVRVGISNKVTTIPSEAFRDCHALKEVRVPATVQKIDKRAFEGCMALSKFRISSKTKASSSSTSTSSVLQFIGPRAFSACSSLTGIRIPAGVTTTGRGTFEDCYKLKKAEFAAASHDGNGCLLSSIHGYAFMHCHALESIAIPSTVRLIGDSAFENCVNLKRVDFLLTTATTTPSSSSSSSSSSSLLNIGESAFQDCTSLTLAWIFQTL